MVARRDELFEVPPERFVAARNALVKELRAAGKTKEAKEIAALRKPTRLLYALNQLARSHPAEMKKLLDAGAALRAALHKVMGGAEASSLREAEADLRRAILAVGDDSTRGILRAAAVGEDAMRRALGAGRLEQLPEKTSGFDVAGIPAGALRRGQAAKAARARAGRAAEAKQRVQKAKLVREAERLRAQARRYAKEAEEAERRARAAAERASR